MPKNELRAQKFETVIFLTSKHIACFVNYLLFSNTIIDIYFCESQILIFFLLQYNYIFYLDALYSALS